MNIWVAGFVIFSSLKAKYVRNARRAMFKMMIRAKGMLMEKAIPVFSV